MEILKIWQDYFASQHEGLGTTYERFILHEYFSEFTKEFQIENVLEVPCFGMTGISVRTDLELIPGVPAFALHIKNIRHYLQLFA